MIPKRLITKRQEEAFRLCHHNFSGLTQEETAKIMGITRRAVCRLLNNVKKVLPQYFPILTKQEAKIYHYYMVEGWSVFKIIKHTGLLEDSIYKTLQRARKKGKYFSLAKGRILSLDKLRRLGDYENSDGDHIDKPSDWIDCRIKQQF